VQLPHKNLQQPEQTKFQIFPFWLGMRLWVKEECFLTNWKEWTILSRVTFVLRVKNLKIISNFEKYALVFSALTMDPAKIKLAGCQIINGWICKLNVPINKGFYGKMHLCITFNMQLWKCKWNGKAQITIFCIHKFKRQVKVWTQ